MKTKPLNLSTVLPICLILFVFFSACAGPNGESGQPTKPTANIASPTTNTNLKVGDEILITFSAADVKGINQIELTVDGQPVMVEAVEPPVNSYTAGRLRRRAVTSLNYEPLISITNLATRFRHLF